MAETSKPRTPRKKAADAETAAKPKKAAAAKPAAPKATAKAARPAAEAKPKKAAAKAAEAQPVAAKAPRAPRKKAAAEAVLVQRPSAPSLEERQRWVATAAYHRAEKRGFAPGYEVQDWLEAEAEIDQLIGKA